MKKERSVLCVECAEKIKEIRNLKEIQDPGRRYRKCALCDKRGALSLYEHWPKTKQSPAEELMEIVCKLCHHPYTAETQEILDEHCDSCPVEYWLKKREVEL